MGHVRSRSFTHLPADTPVGLLKIQPKSLFRDILPVTPLSPIFCIANPLYPQQNKDLRGRGSGMPTPHIVPISGNFSTAPMKLSLPLPMLPAGAPDALPGGFMRRLLIALLLCSCAIAQDSKPVEGPDFSRGARPRGSFYLNGIGHQYLEGKNYTVVAAAVPVLNGKFFGVKLHVFNRAKTSVNVLPDSITAEDSVGAKSLALYSSAEVNDKLASPSTM